MPTKRNIEKLYTQRPEELAALARNIAGHLDEVQIHTHPDAAAGTYRVTLSWAQDLVSALAMKTAITMRT